MSQPLNASIDQVKPLPFDSSISSHSSQAIAPIGNSAQPPHSVAFVDTRLAQVDQLVAGIAAEKIVLIDAQQNGIEQITATLAQYDSLSSVHIFSHGNPGSLQLGNASLNADNIDRYSNRLSQWGSALLGEADLMLYGCDLTSSESGLALVQQISDLTGADVAASDDTTGASNLGGDWQLETRVGNIESAIALNQSTQATYAGTLDLLNNGDFEANLTSWSRFTGTETTTAAGALNGQSLQVTAANGGVGQIVPATAGETYKLKSFAKSSATSGFTGIGIRFLDADREVINDSSKRISTNQWRAYEIEDVAGAGTQFMQVWAYKQNGGGILSLDNLELSVDTSEPPTSDGVELLENPGFEAGLAPWGTFSGTEALSTATTFAGSQSLQLSGADSGAGQIVDASAGDEFIFSIYGKTTNTGYVSAGFNFFDADFNSLDFNASRDIDISGDSWKRYQQTATAPAQTRYVRNWIYQANASGSTFLDDLSLSKRGSAAADTTAPTASLTAETLTAAGTNSFDFTVTYRDATAIDTSSLDNNDIRVTGPNGFSQNAAFVSATPTSDGTPRTATYRLTSPAAGWTDNNNGTYTVQLKANQVEDTLGNKTAATNLGTFDIDIETDVRNFGNISLGASNVAVNESDGNATLTVVRTGGSDGTVTVDYGILSGSATANVDFTPVTGTLTFAEGETEKTVDVAILDDDIEEETERFGFAIDNVNGGATLLVPRTAQVTITDDDAPDGDDFTYRGNRYRLTTAKTWEAAQAEAESANGNLVTINGAAEEAWLKDTFGTSPFWIGLSDRATEGTFEWASGEAVVYTNWAPGEPNDFGSGQDYAQMNFSGSKQWDDAGATTNLRGIIEIGGDNSPDDVTPGTGNGLKGEYYNNIDFTDPVLNRTDRTVDFDWGTASPDLSIGNDTFSARWTGRIEPLYSETYTFQTTSDDGVRLFVNDQLIIDKFINQAPTAHTGTITLDAGEQYDIRMEYYERDGGALAKLAWSSASQVFQIVPQSQLYSDPVTEQTLVAETIISGLTQPTSIEWQPDTNRMFVSEKRGIVKIFENGTLNPEPFIDISRQVNGARDRGLLDIAIHPNFPSTPYVYLLYTYDPPEVFNNTGGTEAGPDGKNNRAGRLTRVTADASTNYTTAVADSEVILLGKNSTWDNFNGFINSTEIENIGEPPAGVLPDGSYQQDILVADSESHTVGGLAFGLDGALYVTNGDGASYNQVDPRATRVQDVDSLSGKVLRIDPITGAGFADNPFYNGDVNANRSKVYQYGLRNPFRITVDQDNGNLYIGDVGLTAWEEINSAAPGANFGWPYFEGGDGESLQTGDYKELPEAIAFYNSGDPVEPSIRGFSHSETGINAIVLGDIYTGDAYPDKYKGDLFFNDLGQGIVRNVSLDASGNVTDIETFATGANVVVHIEEGPDGALYYTDLDDGTIGRWVFEDVAPGQRAFKPSTIPPLAKPAFAPRKRSNRPNFFLAP